VEIITTITDIAMCALGLILGTAGTYFFLKARDKKLVRGIERALKKCSLRMNDPKISSLDKMFKLGESTAYNKILNLMNGKKKEIEE
jgi:hypothetical protein